MSDQTDLRQNSQDPCLYRPQNGRGEDSPGISPDLYNRLRAALINCGPFSSSSELKAAFVDQRLSPWQNWLPEADDPTERAERVIELLYNRYNDAGENALVLLLRTLSERLNSRDACYQRLVDLASEAHREITTRNSAGRVNAGREIPQILEVRGKRTLSKSYTISMLSGLLFFILGVLGNLVAAWYQEKAISEQFTTNHIVIIVLLAILGMIAAAWVESKYHNNIEDTKKGEFIGLHRVVFLKTKLFWSGLKSRGGGIFFRDFLSVGSKIDIDTTDAKSNDSEG